MIKVGIIGATGYAGGELVRILMGHKDAEIKWYGSRSYVDQKYADVYRNMFQIVDAKCMDDNMEELADQVIDLIGKAQEPDGYLNTYFSVNAPAKKWTNLVEGHELYTAGHMIEAAVAYYQATGKEKILNIAKKNADLICRVFGTGKGQKRGYPGHQEIELALVKLYRETGKKIYLQQARYFIQERGRNPNYLQY